ncbi:MAG: hypothetical protein K8S27_01730, partial [Candidatus Omnitrophica bacterium]|nr:hypothetical protein [Candidatus Omnitrophota bacterium]
TTETPPGGGSNTYVHDEDGNLTSISGNKNVTYTYNAENRLVSAQPTTPVAGDKKVEFLYDYQGRRVQKIISSWNGSWTVDTTKHFVYDGWNVIQEITTAQPTKYYVWGLDLSQSLQGAGGVGGLLAVIEGISSWNYLYDGNGNVGQMINSSTGLPEAHYEYDPYGNEIVASGTLASSNPYRFSTKYLDDEFNLYYYGYRYYDPETGRWLNRDPIEEEGGFNLYSFTSNNSINNFDALGQTGTELLEPLIEKIPKSISEEEFWRMWGANPKTTNTLFQKAFRGVSKYNYLIFAASVGLEIIDHWTSEEKCLWVITEAFRKRYQLTDEEVQVMKSVVLSASMGGKEEVLRKYKDDKRFPIYWVIEEAWPNIYKHTDAFIKIKFGDHMQILHYNGPNSFQTKKNRRKVAKLKPLYAHEKKDNYQFDEYPMASTREGGDPSVVGYTVSVKYVPALENRQQGAFFLHFYPRHKMKKDDPFITVTVPRGGIQ